MPAVTCGVTVGIELMKRIHPDSFDATAVSLLMDSPCASQLGSAVTRRCSLWYYLDMFCCSP
jgi:hypothetical protein